MKCFYLRGGIFNGFRPDPAPNNIMVQFILIGILTLINAFFASAEMAIVSLNKNKIKHLAEEGNKKALLL